VRIADRGDSEDIVVDDQTPELAGIAGNKCPEMLASACVRQSSARRGQHTVNCFAETRAARHVVFDLSLFEDCMIYSLGTNSPQLHGNNFIAANAIIVGDVVLGKNTSVWWSVVIRGDNDRITLGDNVNIQDGSVLHTDEGVPLRLENDVSVGHLAMLHGCTVKEGSLIGINAVVLNRAVIGRECLIGANSLIPEGKVIPDRSLVLGSPGRVVRQLGDDEVKMIRWISQHYVENAARYLRELKRVDT
jgi:carbonic anhydrase/acetyltransferase-like protein (isoleucine patch superfamily)